MSVFVKWVQFLDHVAVVSDAEDVGVVKEVEEEPKEREQDQRDPVVAQEKSQQRHFGVFCVRNKRLH